MKRWWLLYGGAVGVGLIAVVTLLVLPKPFLPKTVTQPFPATVLAPALADVQLDRDSAKYDAPTKLLSYILTYQGAKVVVSEQPTPESFSEIPQVYDKVLENMHEYSKFEVDAGVVHLTRPPDLGGRQAAVLNAKGTLLFAKASQDLGDDDWRRFFKGLVVVQ